MPQRPIQPSSMGPSNTVDVIEIKFGKYHLRTIKKIPIIINVKFNLVHLKCLYYSMINNALVCIKMANEDIHLLMQF